MRRRGLSVCLCAIGLGLLLAAAAKTNPAFHYTSIDFPGAVLTNAQGINPGGEIVGFYQDTAGHQHGFWLAGGNFVSIDYPGAISTAARGISPGGDIVGNYTDAPGGPPNVHGFLLSQGSFSIVQSPDPNFPGAIPQRIGPNGDIYGCIHNTDLMGTMHGFVRTADGYSAITLPASMHNGATPDGRVIVGLYRDMMTGLAHGYVIDNGNFVNLDVPNSNFTRGWDINPAGEIVGEFRDLTGKFHGFLRTASGFSSVDFPAAIATSAIGVNPRGDVVGSYTDSSGKTHGYLLSRAH
jgi:hypothetical protein